MSWCIPCKTSLRKWALFMACLCLAFYAQAQTVERMHKQRSFATTVPSGDYSGLTWLGGNDYAVVCDKIDDAFLHFYIDIDSLTGKINNVEYVGRQPLTVKRRDPEDIVFVKQDSTFFICCESDNEVWEYNSIGIPTGRKLQVPKVFSKAGRNSGIEALAYHPATGRFWITSESTITGDGEQTTAMNGVANHLRIQSFGPDLKPQGQYLYVMDKAMADKPAYNFAMGVSAMTALPDGRLLVLERELHVPKGKLGAYVNCKIYCVATDKGNPVDTQRPLAEAVPLEKKMLCEWRTTLTLLNHAFANYEGMCLGPTLSDGSLVLLLLSDSQHQYAGVLKDWFKTIVIRP